MPSRILFTLGLLACLSACSQEPTGDQTQASAGAPASVPADAAAPASATASSPTFSVEPVSPPACGRPVVATLKWDVRTTHPDVAAVQIFAGTDEAPALFAEGGNYGEAQTAAWTEPGSIFRLRDKASGKELERVVVAGTACQ